MEAAKTAKDPYNFVLRESYTGPSPADSGDTGYSNIWLFDTPRKIGAFQHPDVIFDDGLRYNPSEILDSKA